MSPKLPAAFYLLAWVVLALLAWTHDAAGNVLGQSESWPGDPARAAGSRLTTMAYDNRGNRSAQTITLADTTQQATSYQWDFQNRLIGVTLPDASDHAYAYDYRIRRISRAEPAGATAVSWSGGLSLAEYAVSGLQGTVANALAPTVEYRRGPDMGGGIGGLLHSLRGGAAKYNLGNGRGDVVAQSDESGALTWTASYEAFGKRPVETGVWLSRDPAGFVDGPNLYADVRQNPWTHFDPLGLAEGQSQGADRTGIPMRDDKEAVRKIELSPVTNFLIDSIPVLGTAKGISEIYTGNNLLAGESLSGFDKGVAITGIAVSVVTFAKPAAKLGGKLIKGIKTAIKGSDEGVTSLAKNADSVVETAKDVSDASAAKNVTMPSDKSKLDHIFDSKKVNDGHLAPMTESSRKRDEQMFENVASDRSNLRPDLVSDPNKKKAGIEVFTKEQRKGQVWVESRGDVIQNAGVNRKGASR